MSIANLNLENIALKYSREKEKINNFHNLLKKEIISFIKT